MELKNAWSNAFVANRTLKLPLYSSLHFRDISYSFCDIFTLPPRLVCEDKVTADEFAHRSERCIIPTDRHQTWATKWINMSTGGHTSNYNLSEVSYSKIEVGLFDWNKDHCILAAPPPLILFNKMSPNYNVNFRWNYKKKFYRGIFYFDIFNMQFI